MKFSWEASFGPNGLVYTESCLFPLLKERVFRMKFVCLLLATLVAAPVMAQGFDLKPGEVVGSIDGKPVTQTPAVGKVGVTCINGKCSIASTPHQVRKAGRQAAREVRRNLREYHGMRH